MHSRVHTVTMDCATSGVTHHMSHIPPFLITLSPTIPSHHLTSRNEHGLDTPPNFMGTHHLSIDGQQREHERERCQNRGNDSEHEIDQNIGQDNPRECGQPTPPRTSSLPLSSRDVCVHTTSKQERRANSTTAPPSSCDTRTKTARHTNKPTRPEDDREITNGEDLGGTQCSGVGVPTVLEGERLRSLALPVL